MVQLAAQAAGSPTFSETALRRTLRGIATNSYNDDTSILWAIEQGFAQSVTPSQADGIITQQEEEIPDRGMYFSMMLIISIPDDDGVYGSQT